MDKDKGRDNREIVGILDTVVQNRGPEQLACWLPLQVEMCLVDLLVVTPRLRSNRCSRILRNHSNQIQLF